MWKFVAAACIAVLAGPATAQTAQSPFLGNAAFLDTIGINQHLNYLDGAYANHLKVLASLQYLGIRHVRDAAPQMQNNSSALLSRYITFGRAGIKFTLLPMGGKLDVTLPRDLAQMRALQTAVPGSVEAVEGVNEMERSTTVPFAGLVGQPAVLASQKYIYETVKADPLFKGVPVYSYTSTKADLPTKDYFNGHLYPQRGDPADDVARLWISRAWNTADVLSGKIKRVLTEFGYPTRPDANYGVDELTQAKLTLTFLMDAARVGVTRSYIYELVDQKPDAVGKDAEKHFGLFRNDFTAKPAATAIHNLTTILADSEAKGRALPQSLAYAVGPLPTGGRSLLLRRSDGAFFIVVWDETRVWNATTLEPVPPVSKTTTVKFGSDQNVAVFDPMISSSPQTTKTRVRELSLTYSDHPVIIKVW